MELPSWSYLEAELIEKVVICLKDAHRWRRDAPSLRLVNKQWSFEIDRHICSVHPHISRPIDAKDLPSLRKFGHLSSLDATRFVREYEADNRPSMGILTRLPHLSRLKLASENCRGIGVSALMALKGITSLVLETSADSHFTDRDLKSLGRLPLKHLAIRCPIHRMEPFFRQCRSLEYLDAQVLSGDKAFPYDAALLNGVTSLRLAFRMTAHGFELPNLAFLSSVRSLTDVDLFSFCSEDLDWLIDLPCLRSLRVTVATMEVFSTVAFLHVLGRLRGFQARNSSSQPLEMANVIRRGTQLRSLGLHGFKVDCHLVKEHLDWLESLALNKCSLLNSQYFFPDLKPLRHLTFHCPRDPFAALRMGDANLSLLKILKLTLHSVDSIAAIARLTQLVVLGLRTCNPLSPHALRQLGTLPSLVEFGVSPRFPESSVSAFLKSEAMQQLETLYLPEEGFKFNASSMQLLKQSGTQLIVDTNVKSFEYFMQAPHQE